MSYPYIPSAGIVVKAFAQFRKMLPAKIDAETLRKLSLAPANESMVINLLRFLGFIDDVGARTKEANAVFLKHDDVQFSKELEKVVRSAYSELFDTVGEDVWTAGRPSLIGFFRVHDETSAITATRQAITFEALAALSGHGEIGRPKTYAPKEPKAVGKGKTDAGSAAQSLPIPKSTKGGGGAGREFGLSVRVEINLPAQGDQATYDRIFKSIRENLLNG